MKSRKIRIVLITAPLILLLVMVLLLIGCDRQNASESCSTSFAGSESSSESVSSAESEEDDEEYIETDVSEFTIENGKLISYNGKESSIKIPTCVTEIEIDAFYKAKDFLNEITIPSSVVNINMGETPCAGLKGINVQKSSRYFASKDGVLFSKDFTKLVWYPPNKDGIEYTVPDTVKIISESAFKWNKNLQKIYIPESVSIIEKNAFGCSGKLEEVHLPSSLQVIGAGAFQYCYSIKEIDIPDSVNTMGNSVFFQCKNLKKIKIPKNLSTIPNSTFYQCYSLEEVVMHDKVSLIGILTFFECTSLQKIEIPANVTEIQDRAFENCTALKEVSIPDNVTLRERAFYGVPWAHGHLPEFVITFNQSVNMDVLSGYYGKGGDVVIPEDVYCILEPFDKIAADKITSLTFPNSITKSTQIAMADDNLVNLTNLYVHKDNPSFASVDGVIYTKDKSTLVAFPNGRSGSFTIPDGVTKINDDAFKYCLKIEHLIIPDSVTTIEWQAFYGCKSLKSVVLPAGITALNEVFLECENLKTIYFKGTEEQWKNIRKDGFDADGKLENVEIVFNYELT